jgi:hypothetical protein
VITVGIDKSNIQPRITPEKTYTAQSPVITAPIDKTNIARPTLVNNQNPVLIPEQRKEGLYKAFHPSQVVQSKPLLPYNNNGMSVDKVKELQAMLFGTGNTQVDGK